MSRSSRAALRWLAGGLAAAGAGVALLATSQPWVRAEVAQEGLPRVLVEATGRDVAPVVAALGLVGLAGAVALLATRGWLQRAVAVLVALAGVGSLVAAWGPAGDPREAVRPEVADAVGQADPVLASVGTTAWPWLALVASVVLAVGGALGLFAPGARAMSSRYERPGAAGEADGVDLDDPDAVWKALDRGEDPTAG